MIKSLHYEALLTGRCLDALLETGKWGRIIHTACMKYGSTKEDRAISNPTLDAPQQQKNLVYAPVQVLVPVWDNWSSSDGAYTASCFRGYSVQTLFFAAEPVPIEVLKWSVAARDVLALFHRRKGPSLFHFGKALFGGRAYSLDLLKCCIESADNSGHGQDGQDEVYAVRLVLKQLGASTSGDFVIEFRNCHAAPVHHNFERHFFVSGVLTWHKKELVSSLLACESTNAAFTIEACMRLF